MQLFPPSQTFQTNLTCTFSEEVRTEVSDLSRPNSGRKSGHRDPWIRGKSGEAVEEYKQCTSMVVVGGSVEEAGPNDISLTWAPSFEQ